MVLLQDIPAKPDTAAVDAGRMAAAPADSSATALVEEDSPVLAEESPAALTGSGNVELARQDAADVPLRRDGWLSPIELDERAEPLTTAIEAPQTPAAATKRFGSSRSRRASDRGLLPMTLESYLSLLDWTGRQLRWDEWCDPAVVGVNPRPASGLGRVVAGDGGPVRPPVPPRWAWPTICKPRPSVWAWPGCTACAGAKRHSRRRSGLDYPRALPDDCGNSPRARIYGRHVTILNATISGATIAVSPGLAGRTPRHAPSLFRLTSQISESRQAM